MKRKGFTLVETLVVITIFSIVGVITLNAYITSMKTEQRSSLQNSIIQDSKYVLATIASEISNNTIDYEEYFNQCVIGNACPNVEFVESLGNSPYGTNHGYYSWQFYYGGVQNSGAPIKYDGFGAVCQVAGGGIVDYPNDACITNRLSFSEDYQTGQNPSAQSFEVTNPAIADTATAICGKTEGFQTFKDNGTEIFLGTTGSPCDPSNFKSTEKLTMNELYLISADGNTKTIIGKEKISGGASEAYSVSLGKLVKKDQIIAKMSPPTSTDIPVPVYGFTCVTGYICNSTSDYDTVGLSEPIIHSTKTFKRNDLYTYADTKNIFDDFVPISPLRVNIKTLKFIVSPIEDPYKAYSEPGTERIQPKVTIILEIEPSKRFKLPFFSPNFNLKLQTTVTAGVTTEVPLNTPID